MSTRAGAETINCLLCNTIGVLPTVCRHKIFDGNNTLPILVLLTISSCQSVEFLSYANRLKACRDNSSKKSGAARAGFVSSDGIFKCAFCGAETEEVGSFPLFMVRHKSKCKYRDLLAYFQKSTNKSLSFYDFFSMESETKALIQHLQSELRTTKATVAEEMDFTKDEVCLALSRQFLKTGAVCKNAGQLVDLIFDYPYPSVVVKQLSGIADFITSISLSPPRTCPSKTISRVSSNQGYSMQPSRALTVNLPVRRNDHSQVIYENPTLPTKLIVKLPDKLETNSNVNSLRLVRGNQNCRPSYKFENSYTTVIRPCGQMLMAKGPSTSVNSD